MGAKSKLLLVGRADVPENLRLAAAERWDIQPYRSDEPLAEQLDGASLAVIHPNGAPDELNQLGPLLKELDCTAVVAIFMLTGKAGSAYAALCKRKGQFMCVDNDAPVEELAAKLAAAEALQPRIRDLQNELAATRELHANTTRTFEELDEEMRLAARLQRDFLPRRLAEVGPARFGVLYRPAGWLSGDIYDVARLDETHVGFYVVDAVGHGMPAALLTMFIKKALQTKRIVGNTYEIVPPHISLGELNTDICEQNLSSCQFCTAVYGVFDAETSTLVYSRAGHPEPILIHADGELEKLSLPGSLLGVFPQEQYHSRQVQLRPGDRLLLYTDGAEGVFRHDQAAQTRTIEDVFMQSIGMQREEMLLHLAAQIDESQEGTRPEDDITILVMDLLA